MGEDKNLVIYVADCNGYCIGGKTLKVAVETLRVGASEFCSCYNQLDINFLDQIESASFHDEIRMLASFTHLNVIRLLGVTYLGKLIFEGVKTNNLLMFKMHNLIKLQKVSKLNIQYLKPQQQ